MCATTIVILSGSIFVPGTDCCHWFIHKGISFIVAKNGTRHAKVRLKQMYSKNQQILLY